MSLQRSSHLRTSNITAGSDLCSTCSLPKALEATETHLTASCVTTHRFLLYKHRGCRDTQSTLHLTTFASHTYFTIGHDFVIWSLAALCIYDTRPLSHYTGLEPLCFFLLEDEPLSAEDRTRMQFSSIANHIVGYAVVALREASPLYPNQ